MILKRKIKVGCFYLILDIEMKDNKKQSEQETKEGKQSILVQDPIELLEKIIDRSADKNQVVSDVIEAAMLHKRSNKIFKIEQAKNETKNEEKVPEVTDNKTIEQEVKPEQSVVFEKKPTHAIDDLLNEIGELRPTTHHYVTEDKELNEKLDILMRDFRGRARRITPVEKSVEKVEEVPIKEVKEIPIVSPSVNPFAPASPHWLKFSKVSELFTKIKEFFVVSKAWVQK